MAPSSPPPPPPPPPLPPPSSTALPIMNLLLRIFTFLLLLVSLIILKTNTATLSLDYEDTEDLKFHFKDVYAYRYMLFTILIGIVHSILQTAFALYHVNTGKRLISSNESNDLYQFDFYGDKVISYMLATGAAAAFGATIDLKRIFGGSDSSVDKFFNKASASASLLLIGFVCSAISSIFSSLALPKND